MNWKKRTEVEATNMPLMINKCEHQNAIFYICKIRLAHVVLCGISLIDFLCSLHCMTKISRDMNI